MSPNLTPNVIVFGEAGTGKSSVINLVLGATKAPVSNSAAGCTFESKLYSILIQEKNYNLYDTAGLNEADSGGTVDRHRAIVQLFQLVCKLAKTGGVSLLVFVVRRERLSPSTKKNYDMFHQAICEAQVPIVIVITHCEDEKPMDRWWDRNEERFERAGMRFEGHACVCTSRGKEITNKICSNDQSFEESKAKVNTLIQAHCRSSPGWKKPPLVWFKRIIGVPGFLRSNSISAAYLDLYKRLLQSHPDEEARQVIGLLENGA